MSSAGRVRTAPSDMVALGRPSWAMVGYIAAALICGVLFVSELYFRSHRKQQPLTDKDTIVLADFANTTGDAVFDDALKTALDVSLRQSPFLNVLSDGEVAKTLQLMTRPAGTRLTPDVARELCQRAGSKAYVAGSISSLGREYVLGLKAVNCQNEDKLAEEQVTATSKETPARRRPPAEGLPGRVLITPVFRGGACIGVVRVADIVRVRFLDPFRGSSMAEQAAVNR